MSTLGDHAFELAAPGTHGADSVTGRCSCRKWSTSIFPGAQRESAVARLRAAHAGHAVEERELEAYSDALKRLPYQVARQSGGHDYKPQLHVAMGTATCAAPPRGDAAFEVIVIQDEDGTAFAFPRGYYRGAPRRRLPKEVAPDA